MSDRPRAWSGVSMIEKKMVPMDPGGAPLYVTNRGVCQKLASLSQGSSNRSMRICSGLVG
jgi:hypothetical protein